MELQISQVKNGTKNEEIRGVALMRTVNVAKAKNNNEFIRGTLSTSEGEVDYKIWAGGLQQRVSQNPDKYQGTVVNVLGKVDDYMNNKTITIEDAEITGEDPVEYMRSDYNIDSNKNDFLAFMQDNLSEDGKKIFAGLLSTVKDTFFTEFASVTIHHDNVVGGLTAHSMKCVKVLNSIIDFYPNIKSRVLDKDLIYIGTSLHDLGKAVEYNRGSISEVGKLLSHRTLATEIAARMKKAIVELKGEEWYYRLLSIFEQHHGEFEETPRTVEAYLVHKVDMLESSVTDIDQAVANDDTKVGFRLHGFMLN